MLHVMAVLRFQAQHLEAGSAVMTELAVQSRGEPDCIRYDLFRRAGDDAVLVTQETWTDETVEQAHMKGPNLAAAAAKLGQLLAAPPEIHRYSQVA